MEMLKDRRPIMLKEFNHRCRTCHLAKSTSQNAGLYTPLPVPIAPSEDASLDSFTVVSVDACYTNPYLTDLIVIAPPLLARQLMPYADAPPAHYYMSARAYEIGPYLPFQHVPNSFIPTASFGEKCPSRPSLPSLTVPSPSISPFAFPLRFGISTGANLALSLLPGNLCSPPYV